MSKYCFIAFVIVCFTNCGITHNNKSTHSSNVRDSLSKYMMIEELPDSSVEMIRCAIATADTLTDVFLFQNGGWNDSINPSAFIVMERAMQRSFNYDGMFVYAHEWACHDSVTYYFSEYLKSKSVNHKEMDSLLFQRVLNDIDTILYHYGSGSQADMNTVAFIDMNMNCYKTIGTYKDIVKLCDDINFKKAYFMDYANWIDMFSATNERHQGNYSMYPMEINSYGADMMKFRYNMLQEEISLLRGRKLISWDSSKHPVDWNKFEDSDLLRPWYEGRTNYAEQFKDERLSIQFKKMTDKIAYLYLNNLQFISW